MNKSNGANIQIDIFDDRVKISNPDGLVPAIKKEDFGKKSISRNPLSRLLPGAKQVLGGVEIKKDIPIIDTKTKGNLAALRNMLETALPGSIEFERQEFQDMMEMLRKR